ncbi:MAG: TetR/AcrR family transcriptional regulator [Bryobacterales bacterium]|nr:TetR/AcrR family transcriptional regulator [Bryobacterales bacterium]
MKLFADKGYSATPTSEICRRAGVTKPVLYYHFQSKENLFRELVREACSGMIHELTLASYRGSTAVEKLTDVLTADFALTKRNPHITALVFRTMFAPPKEMPKVDFVQVGLDWIRLVEGILRDGVRRGGLRCRPHEVAVALLGVGRIYSISHLVRGKPDLDRALARRVVRLVVGGRDKNSTGR